VTFIKANSARRKKKNYQEKGVQISGGGNFEVRFRIEGGHEKQLRVEKSKQDRERKKVNRTKKNR